MPILLIIAIIVGIILFGFGIFVAALKFLIIIGIIIVILAIIGWIVRSVRSRV